MSDVACCGSCIQTHCVLDDGTLLPSGDTLILSDPCKITSCEIQDGGVKVNLFNQEKYHYFNSALAANANL